MKKIFCMISIITLVIVSMGANYAYATTDNDQTGNLEINARTIFEDIAKLKEIIKAIYEKISQAGKVDDDLKDNIKEEIDKIDEIDSIDDSELDTIKGELNSKVDDLTDDNLEQSKEDIGTIKDLVEVLPDSEEEFNEQKVQYGERLIKILEENEDQLGDMKELKVVVDTIYEDLSKATTVDEELKNKLREDVDKLDTVSGINPTLASSLKIVLNMQIDDLTDENLNDMKITVMTIKQWVDKKVESDTDDSTNNNNNNNNDNDNKMEEKKDEINASNTNANTIVDETIAKYEKYINPAQAKLFRFMGLDSVEAKAEGWIITDSEGQEFIDCLGGYGMFALGHRHPKVVEAVERELHAMPMCGKVLFNRPMADLAEALAEITPGALQYSFFVNSGTEAVEGCLKIARLATKRSKFVAAKNAFHGKTFGSLTATGRDLYREPFKPLLNGFTHVEYGDAEALAAAVDEETAAVILEPIQGEGGIIVPPAGYLRRAKEICEAKGALLIADEVQTGIGRTGDWFGVNADGVEPDLMACAKALGGGVMPIGAIIGTERAWQGLIEAPFLHTSTFGGNQLACAAGVAAIKTIKEEDILRRGREAGAYLKEGLEKIAAEFPSVITEVRGRGMMLGIELTKEGAGGMLMSLMIMKHIIVAYTLNNPKVIRMEPPLIMPKEVIDHVLSEFRDAVAQTADVIEDL